MFFKRLMDILAMDFQSVPYEKRELILDAINQVLILIKPTQNQVKSRDAHVGIINLWS